MRNSLTALLLLALSLTACKQSDYQKADAAYVAIDGAVTIGLGVVPSLVAAGKIPASEGQTLTAQLGLLGSANHAYKSCIDNVLQTKLPTAGKFVACLSLLADSFYHNQQAAEALRYTNPQTIAEYNLVVSVVSNVLHQVMAQFNQMTPAAPMVAGATPTKSEIQQFEGQVRAATGL